MDDDDEFGDLYTDGVTGGQKQLSVGLKHGYVGEDDEELLYGTVAAVQPVSKLAPVRHPQSHGSGETDNEEHLLYGQLENDEFEEEPRRSNEDFIVQNKGQSSKTQKAGTFEVASEQNYELPGLAQRGIKEFGASQFQGKCSKGPSLEDSRNITDDYFVPNEVADEILVNDKKVHLLAERAHSRSTAKPTGGEENGTWDSDSEDDIQILLNDNNHIQQSTEHVAGTIKHEGSEDEDDEDLIIVADEPLQEDQGFPPETSLPVASGGLNATVEEKGLGTFGEERGQAKATTTPPVGSAGISRVGYAGKPFQAHHLSQYKYVRGSGFPPGGIAAPVGSQGMTKTPASYGAPWGAGKVVAPPGVSTGGQRPLSGPWGAGFGFQNGNEFHLPPTKTVFDIDLESLEEKPWRHPGIDITEYFNFGFNENTWKQYCQQLEQLRLEATMQSKIRVYESGRSDQDFDPDLPPELLAATGMHDYASERQKQEESGIGYGRGQGLGRGRGILPIGRAIQVEGGGGTERRSSVDIRRRLRDSDAVIQIVLQDASEEESNPTVPETTGDEDYQPEDEIKLNKDELSFKPINPWQHLDAGPLKWGRTVPLPRDGNEIGAELMTADEGSQMGSIRHIAPIPALNMGQSTCTVPIARRMPPHSRTPRLSQGEDDWEEEHSNGSIAKEESKQGFRRGRSKDIVSVNKSKDIVSGDRKRRAKGTSYAQDDGNDIHAALSKDDDYSPNRTERGSEDISEDNHLHEQKREDVSKDAKSHQAQSEILFQGKKLYSQVDSKGKRGLRQSISGPSKEDSGYSQGNSKETFVEGNSDYKWPQTARNRGASKISYNEDDKHSWQRRSANRAERQMIEGNDQIQDKRADRESRRGEDWDGRKSHKEREDIHREREEIRRQMLRDEALKREEAQQRKDRQDRDYEIMSRKREEDIRRRERSDEQWQKKDKDDLWRREREREKEREREREKEKEREREREKERESLQRRKLHDEIYDRKEREDDRNRYDKTRRHAHDRSLPAYEREESHKKDEREEDYHQRKNKHEIQRLKVKDRLEFAREIEGRSRHLDKEDDMQFREDRRTHGSASIPRVAKEHGIDNQKQEQYKEKSWNLILTKDESRRNGLTIDDKVESKRRRQEDYQHVDKVGGRDDDGAGSLRPSHLSRKSQGHKRGHGHMARAHHDAHNSRHRHRSSRERPGSMSSDEEEDDECRKGRSKLERWTSQREKVPPPKEEINVSSSHHDKKIEAQKEGLRVERDCGNQRQDKSSLDKSQVSEANFKDSDRRQVSYKDDKRSFLADQAEQSNKGGRNNSGEVLSRKDSKYLDADHEQREQQQDSDAGQSLKRKDRPRLRSNGDETESKHQNSNAGQSDMADFKPERPPRKRRWGSG